MGTHPCVICHADASVLIIDLARFRKTLTVCEACIRIDTAQLAVLLQQFVEERGDDA